MVGVGSATEPSAITDKSERARAEERRSGIGLRALPAVVDIAGALDRGSRRALERLAVARQHEAGIDRPQRRQGLAGLRRVAVERVGQQPGAALAGEDVEGRDRVPAEHHAVLLEHERDVPLSVAGRRDGAQPAGRVDRGVAPEASTSVTQVGIMNPRTVACMTKPNADGRHRCGARPGTRVNGDDPLALPCARSTSSR